MDTHLRKRVAEILTSGRSRDKISQVIDISLVILIFINVIAIALESVTSLLDTYENAFYWFEVFSVAIFTVEYLGRIWSCIELEDVDSKRPVLARIKYMFSPLVLIDFLSILPFYLSFFVALDLRFLRVIRLLRIFKLTRYSSAMTTMLEVLREEASALSAAAFILFILLVLASSGIYLLEHGDQPEAFGSIPAAMWWAMVTLTTVGYGDVVPITTMGKVFGAFISLIGVGMVALPTGILASGFANAFRRRRVSYEREMEVAFEDGVLSREESETLKQVRTELGISHEDAEQIYQLAKHKTGQVKQFCPKCGYNVDLK